MTALRSILKRTGLNQAVIPTAVFANHLFNRNNNVDNMDFETANRILNSFREDLNASSLRAVPKDVSNPQYDVAVIIPCYKCEKTIRKCLDSCANQHTSADFKIIAVDDGSPDTTGEILDDYALSSDKLQVIHQENTGVAGARNAAVDSAKSKYLMFVDADDYLPQGAMEGLFEAAEQEQAFIVQGNFRAVDAAGHIYRTNKTRGGVLDPLKDLKGYPWGKIFRTECFSEAKFPVGYRYEDSVNRQIIYEIVSMKKQKVYGIKQNVYCSWRRNPNNATNSDIGKPCSIDSYYVTKALFNDRKKLGISISNEYYEYILRMVLLSTERIKKASKKIKIAQFFAFREFIITEFKGYHASRKMKYLEKAVLDGDYNLFCIVTRLM